MNSYEGWLNGIEGIKNSGTFENEYKLVIEQGNFYYSNEFLKEEGEKLFKKSFKCEHCVENFVFYKVENKQMGNVSIEIYNVFLNIRSSKKELYSVQIEAKYSHDLNTLRFDIELAPNLKEILSDSIENYLKIKEITKNFIEIFKTRKDLRLLIVTGSLKMDIGQEIKKILNLE